jgi:hypothetical protein
MMVFENCAGIGQTILDVIPEADDERSIPERN